MGQIFPFGVSIEINVYFIHTVVSIEFSTLSTVELTSNWYQLIVYVFFCFQFFVSHRDSIRGPLEGQARAQSSDRYAMPLPLQQTFSSIVYQFIISVWSNLPISNFALFLVTI